ncbi:NAD(P)-dependent oxidoreductase [Methylophaga sp.]|jgi:3-hydroxyisobutyrate dehydrogenase|uniref:NAD(P)-dependent oxidoreductase n=1 Tax=Methylophaga sp. TaxID=2024840 RepID=UPI001400C3EF|nr:NAD(P)-dependent oxidoreductase [Methylophaga sp.]MTI64128.1 NAD(P)-dependent oxidoreductase [Methylophaga sp.]
MKIGLIGTGLMGQALATHLLAENQPLMVYNRSPEKSEELQERGAEVASSAQEVVEQCDICLLFLSDAEAIQMVLDSIDATAFRDTLIIQMGTIAPEESRHFAEQISTQKGRYLECPVLGSLPEARSGKLILMAGGSDKDFQTALPLLELIGKHPQHIGSVGQGATVKLAMNQLIAGLTASFALSLALVEKEGIETEQFMKIVRDSALYAPTFDKKLSRMLERDFDNPNFPTKHLAKDTRLFLSVAEELGLDTSALQGIEILLQKTLEMGLDNTDYSALMAAVSPRHK